MCLRCGKCCKNIPLRKDELDLFAHILKLEGKWEPNNVIYYPPKNIWRHMGMCPFLAENKDGTTYCRINSFKPMVCKLFPLSGVCPTTKDKQNGETE